MIVSESIHISYSVLYVLVTQQYRETLGKDSDVATSSVLWAGWHH